MTTAFFQIIKDTAFIIMKSDNFELTLFFLYYQYHFSPFFSLQFLNKLAISTLFPLSILPLEAVLGCTQEEIGRAGWCAVCINSWYLPACVFLCAPSCHCQTTTNLKLFISQIFVVDDEGYVLIC